MRIISIYETLTLMITFGSLIVLIITSNQKK
ncbi:putative holin-like toxin [Pontibacillus salicampi]|uniref:Holin-like toxin n=1 Tax=Pontibacillus salicampi TaxID=1449801 RepID=A0ABV6LIN0_9BACI